MRAVDFIRFTSIAATTALFQLSGGSYAVSIQATWGGGNVQPQQLGPDGSTWLNLGSPITSDGVATFTAAPGQFRLAVTTATAINATVTRIPGE